MKYTISFNQSNWKYYLNRKYEIVNDKLLTIINKKNEQNTLYFSWKITKEIYNERSKLLNDYEQKIVNSIIW